MKIFENCCGGCNEDGNKKWALSPPQGMAVMWIRSPPWGTYTFSDWSKQDFNVCYELKWLIRDRHAPFQGKR